MRSHRFFYPLGKGRILSVVCTLAFLCTLLVMPSISASGMSPNDWESFGNPSSQDGDGINLCGQHSYKTALSPDYIQFDMAVRNLNPSVDGSAIISIGFVNSDGKFDPDTASPTGIAFTIRNDWDNGLNIDVVKTGTPATSVVSGQTFADLKAGGSAFSVKLQKQPDNSFALTLGTHKIALPGVAAADFTNGEGKTYLAVCVKPQPTSMDDVALRNITVMPVTNTAPPDTSPPVPTLEDGMVAASWNDFGDTCEDVTAGVRMHDAATYIPGLNPDYIEFDWTIDSLPGTVDSWIGMGFVNKNDKNFFVLNSDPAGVGVLMRNLSGRLAVTVFTTDAFGAPIVNERALSATAPGKINVRLQKQTSGSYVLSFDTVKIPLPGVTAANFTDGAGKTYLAFCAYNAAGMEPHVARQWTVGEINQTPDNSGGEAPLPTLEDGMVASSWNDFGGSAADVSNGVQMYSDATYIPGLNPDYIEFDWTINNMPGTVDTWIGLGFVNSNDSAFFVENQTPGGIGVLMRNINNSINVTVFKTGSLGTPIVKERTLPIANPGRVKVRLAKQDDGSYTLCFGSHAVPLIGITKADFTDAAGKTYLGFCAYSAAGMEAADARKWTVGAISQVPGEDEPDGDYYWVDPYNSISQKDGYFTAFSDIAYTRPFEPGTISLNLQFDKLTPTLTEDMWDAFVQVNLTPASGVPESGLSGVAAVFRNLGGKLLVDIVANGEAVSPEHPEYSSWTFFRKLMDVNALDTRLNVVFKSDSYGTRWNIYVNDVKITDEPLLIPRAYTVNSDGYTYMSLIARSQSGEAPDMRAFRIYGTNADNTAFENLPDEEQPGFEDNGGGTDNVSTGDSINIWVAGFLIILFSSTLLILEIRKKHTRS